MNIRNKNEILQSIKENIQDNKQWFYMICEEYNYIQNNFKKEIDELGFEIYIPEKMIFLSNPPNYKVFLRKLF